MIKNQNMILTDVAGFMFILYLSTHKFPQGLLFSGPVSHEAALNFEKACQDLQVTGSKPRQSLLQSVFVA